MAIKDKKEGQERSRLMEVLQSESKVWNYFILVLSIALIILAVFLFNGTLEIKSTIPIIGSFPKTFTWIIMVIGVVSLVYAIFPFAQSVNRMDVINNIRNRLVSGKAKKFSVLSSEERRYMMIRELFIHKKLENSKNAGVDIMQDKFPNVSAEQIAEKLNQEMLKGVDYMVNVDAWCQFCANRELCTAYYSKPRD